MISNYDRQLAAKHIVTVAPSQPTAPELEPVAVEQPIVHPAPPTLDDIKHRLAELSGEIES